ncbi:monovalent cation/H+ antiporter complex subunit F [Nitrospira sp. Kam-Ns4a]
MHSLLLGVFVALVVLMVVYLYRMVRGPTLFDRLLGLNGLSGKVTVLMLVIGTLYERLDMFADISVGYALLNLIGAVAVTKYLELKGVPAEAPARASREVSR